MDVISSVFLHTALSPSPYSWDSKDSKMVENVDFILAADGNRLISFAPFMLTLYAGF